MTAGPDKLTNPGVRYEFPAPPKMVRDLRVAVWMDAPQAPIDDEVRSAITKAAMALRDAGAKVDFDARPDFDPAAAHETYLKLLWAIIGARSAHFDDLQKRAAAIPSSDQSADAVRLRGMVPSFKEAFDANNRRELLRWAWRAFFDRYDVMLAPITVTAAFPHDHSEPQPNRIMRVNGKDTPYLAQLFWAGLATCSLLPSTVAPVGLSSTGLPLGLQIMGPEMGDRVTMWVAGELEKLVGGFVPPPGYR